MVPFQRIEFITEEKSERLYYLENKVEELLQIIEKLENGQAIYIAHKNDKIDK